MNEDIKDLQRALIEDMTEYLGTDDDDEVDPDFDAGYTQAHIDRCQKILDAFFATLSKVGGGDRRDAIMAAVEKAVVDLNVLNDETGGGLIETDQREQLCEIITESAREAGLQTDTHDITEAWREW